jgi:ubiquinone biosynthesis protein COQ4
LICTLSLWCFDMTVIPFHHPKRPGSEFHPLKAWRHFRKLIADKEDTEQVFHIIAALRGKKFRNIAKKFWFSDKGQQILGSSQRLIDILDDHAALKKLPAGTVGRAYVDFMEREGLTAAGLEAEYAKFEGNGQRFNDGIDRYGDRLRDTHDMLHVLTGYGRDALGEQCVLAFTYAQNRNLGVGFIAYAGGLELKRNVARKASVMSAVWEAQKLGDAALNIVHEDIVALLREPLADARKRLGIGEPKTYWRAHEEMRAHGVDPYDLLAAAA